MEWNGGIAESAKSQIISCMLYMSSPVCMYLVLPKYIAPPPLPYQDKQIPCKFTYYHTHVHGKSTTHQSTLHYVAYRIMNSHAGETSNLVYKKRHDQSLC